VTGRRSCVRGGGRRSFRRERAGAARRTAGASLATWGGVDLDRRDALRLMAFGPVVGLFDWPPPVGRPAPWFALEGSSGAIRTLWSYAGRVLLLMYEDRDSQDENAALKAEVRRRIADERLAGQLVVVPVADVRRYDYWPARKVVRNAVAEQARALGTEILLDWKGDVLRRYGFHSPGSNVALVGHDGPLLYLESGSLTAWERRQFHEALTAGLAARARARPRRVVG